MNLKVSGIVSIMIFAATVFAAPQDKPATPSGASETATSAQATAVEPTSNQPVETLPAGETETKANDNAENVSAQAVAEPAPATSEPEPATVTPPAEQAPTQEMTPESVAAPTAVRGGENPTPVQETAAPATNPAPAKKVVYQTVYAPGPVELNGRPVHTVYVGQPVSPDSINFDELRGYVPLKLTFGLQGFIGSYHMFSSYNDDYYINDYDGITWRAGLFGIFPLNEYTIALKFAALFEQSESKASGSNSKYSLKGKFRQRKVDVPLLFAFKASRSTLMFEIGTQVSFAIMDEFRTNIGGKTSKLDMLDKDFRNSIDWDILCGFSIMANRFVGFDFRANVGLSNLYDTDNSEVMQEFNVDDLSSMSFILGVSFYVL